MILLPAAAPYRGGRRQMYSRLGRDMETLTLYELNALVRGTLENVFGGRYWLAAELSELRVASNGHCYVEFVEKAPDGNGLVARARGNIWRGTYEVLAAHFERTAGQRLSAGMKVLVRVAVTFHELYGYALNVTDIDPSYTLGDMARRRREILARLEADGVLTLNKELPLPRIPWRIAVISSGTAAGYGDFRDQLARSGYEFRTRLFAAVMQGEQIERSVIAALDAVAAAREDWDAVVVIRGGGAVSDLGGFDTYLLAANVAQFPLPVLTGIGHERDDTVIDFVAHTRLKTPTAVAAFLVGMRRDEEEKVVRLSERLGRAVLSGMGERRQRFEACAAAFRVELERFGGRRREHLLRLSLRMNAGAGRLLDAAHRMLDAIPARMEHGVQRRFADERHRQELVLRSLRMAGPERILDMGFSITLLDGKPVREASRLKEGDRIVTRLAEGEVHSIVTTDKQEKT